jgi:hypothetical protein
MVIVVLEVGYCVLSCMGLIGKMEKKDEEKGESINETGRGDPVYISTGTRILRH